MADSISAIPQQPFLGRLAEFLRFLEKDRPEFLPPQLGVMQGISKLALPQASTVENLSYGNLPFTMPPSGTGAMIPQAKTGRKPEIADLVSMISGVPGAGAVADVGTKLSNQAADALVRAITRNPQATAPQVIRETSMPFMQAVAPRTPGLLETPVKSDLGFYSALEQATVPLQNKGTGSQFLAQIEKTAGVKPDEIKWTGLDEFLKSKPNVTKAEVQDYLSQNRVNLQEVRLGGATSPYPYRTADEWQGAINRAEAAGNWDEATNINQAWEAAEGFGSAGSTKFSQYTLPGGENYREILLTLPFKEPKMPKGYEVSSMQYDDGTVRYFAETPTTRSAGYKTEAEAQSELQRMTEGLKDWRASQASYRSTHFDQPNILAHMRVNDRVVDGKKTLFIEEIQSDWHQAGRKKGYADKDKPWEVFDPVTANIVGRYASETEAAAAKSEINKAGKMYVDIGKSEGVPDAPFKTTWHELSLKRAIQEASEKGYDQIAFTTGKTQAERYDLSKQIGQITARPTPDGKVALEALTPDMREQVISKVVNVDELDDIVGKEISDKIRTQIKFPKNFDDRGKSVELSGLDLQVGGEGMKGFYDQILPKSLDKLAKKFDAKVGKTEMDGVEVWQMDITPKMRESVLTKGQPLFAATPAVGLLGRDEEQ